MTDALSHFSAPVRDWFRATFSAPTAAQECAWESIRNGNNTLIIAPTGSGKTLAAFLWALDALHREHEAGTTGGTRILYISPLKALGADVERNLRAPLTGITRLSGNNTDEPNISVGVRSGDTPARERSPSNASTRSSKSPHSALDSPQPSKTRRQSPGSSAAFSR